MGHPALLIRADAGFTIGTGHVMRMIALAQAWRDFGGTAVFACSEITCSLETRLTDEGFLLEKIDATAGSQEDLTATQALLSKYSGDARAIVVLDGYKFDSAFQLGVKRSGSRVLVLDDYGHCDFYHADWILNQNAAANEQPYAQRAPNSQLLLGTKFCLLRREFMRHRGWKRETSRDARRVLVTLGGSDPLNVTHKVIEALRLLPLHLKVVLGGNSPHISAIQQLTDKPAGKQAQIELVVNAGDMPALMMWADLAIAAGGSTVWEMAFLGLPAIFLLLAENQSANCNAVEDIGFGMVFRPRCGTADLTELATLVTDIRSEPERRHQLSVKCRQTVDGLGPQRVTKLLCQI